MSDKKITIITPAYNAEKYIENNIKAIINSKYSKENIEHIIVNDGSTDKTREICEKWAKEYKHIKFYNKPNGNWGSVINYVKNNKLATGDYIIVCDSDDIILPNAFDLINKDKSNADYIIGDFWWFNGKRKTLRVPACFYLFKSFFKKNRPDKYFLPIIPPHCSYISKSIFYSISDLVEGVYYQDAALFSEVSFRSQTIKHIRKSLSLYWKNRAGNSMTQHNPLVFKSYMALFHFFEERNLTTPFVYFLLGAPKNIKKELIDKKIKFDFKRKPNFSGFPIYFRPFLWLIYSLKCKKFIKK